MDESGISFINSDFSFKDISHFKNFWRIREHSLRPLKHLLHSSVRFFLYSVRKNRRGFGITENTFSQRSAVLKEAKAVILYDFSPCVSSLLDHRQRAIISFIAGVTIWGMWSRDLSFDKQCLYSHSRARINSYHGRQSWLKNFLETEVKTPNYLAVNKLYFTINMLNVF